MSSKNLAEARSQPSSSHSVQRRKSTSKRPLVHSDDDDDPAPPTTQKMKRPRITDADALSPVLTDDDNDMDVDIDTLSGTTADDSRFLPEDAIPSPSHAAKQGTSKRRRKSTSVAAPTKKKAQVVYSDEDNSHVELDSGEDDFNDSSLPPAEVSDDESELDRPTKRSSLKEKTGTTKGRTGKGKPGQPKQAMGSKDKDKDIIMKDERKLAILPSTTSRASSATAQSQPSELFTNDDLAPSSSVDALSQPIPKKRKLPTIKKTKTATGTATISTPTTTTQKPLPPPPVQELPKPPLPTSEQRKQALTGVRDIDLGDHKVYAELFKGAGGNTPRSGLKNAEERRKELDRMRDEARAKRAEEAKFTFDLQSQADKIARFEQRLRAENSTILHPNFLAAKFRDEWELERRHGRAASKEDGEA